MESLNLRQRLSKDIQMAIAQQKQDRLRALRSVAALFAREERKKKKTNLTDSETVRLLIKAASQKKVAIENYRKQGREVLVKIESDELAIIEEYLPRQLSEEEIRKVVDQIIVRVAAQGEQDIPKVARFAKEAIGLGARGKVILRSVSERLNNSL